MLCVLIFVRVRLVGNALCFELGSHFVETGFISCEKMPCQARALGAKSLFLESNTLLKPAIHTYKKLGFHELAEYHPAYARGDIQMELTLE